MRGRASRSCKFFIFVKKTSSVAGIFIFYQVQKFWSEKKLGHFFSRAKFSKTFRKFSKIAKIFNGKSMKIENLKNFENRKISIFIDFSLKIFAIFENFLKIFEKFALEKKWPNFFFRSKFLNLVKNKNQFPEKLIAHRVAPNFYFRKKLHL